MSLVGPWGTYFPFIIVTEKTHRIMTSSHASVNTRDCVRSVCFLPVQKILLLHLLKFVVRVIKPCNVN